MNKLSYRVIADVWGMNDRIICEADFIESVIDYCKTEGRYHETTFYIQRWLEGLNTEGEYMTIATYYKGTEIPF